MFVKHLLEGDLAMWADTPDNENISDGKEFVDNQSLPS
jgi:hypothetical protein